jgi:HAD superfamily hydrolase (TIGR01450 family)
MVANKYRFIQEGGIRNVVDDYDVFLLDMWGVMHDGIQPYEGVRQVVQKLREAKKKLVILSNSSKRRTNSVKMLRKLGFEDDAFDEIITSGEVAHHLLSYLSGGEQSTWVPQSIPEKFAVLRSSSDETTQRKLSAFCFGSGDSDEEYLNSCGWDLAESIETADLIVARGTFVVLSKSDNANKNSEEAAYWSAYQQALETASGTEDPIPMVVCNPDKVRPDADKSPMPGTIGVAYQKLLEDRHGTSIESDSRILSLGKPFSGVYEIALSAIADEVDKSRVVMVGDALETDVTGANAAEIDSVWVINDGIHNQDISEAASSSSLEDGCEAVLDSFHESSESTYARGKKVSPTVVLRHFRW